MQTTHTRIENILTRTSGYLAGITSHSLQPYRGCTFGNSLCGVGCYVQHNGHVLRGRTWGTFLEVRDNAAESYLKHFPRESAWGRRHHGEFSIFCSSSTDPFLPQEASLGVTRSLLEAMCRVPPDHLLVQTHSPLVCSALAELTQLQTRCRVRVQISIESDLDRLPGLPPPASSVDQRLAACATLRDAGLEVAVAVAPLLPIRDPERFFARISQVAGSVIIDHFIGGDGSPDGSRTRRTALPEAMARVDPRSVSLDYRDQMVEIAQRCLPGRVGVGQDGFAGRWLPENSCTAGTQTVAAELTAERPVLGPNPPAAINR